MKTWLKRALIATLLMGGVAFAASSSAGNVFRAIVDAWGGIRIGKTGSPLTYSYAATATIDVIQTDAGSCSDSAGTTVTGAATSDNCAVGVPAAAGAANGTFSCYVSAANTVKLHFCNPQAATVVDPASGSYNFRVLSP